MRTETIKKDQKDRRRKSRFPIQRELRYRLLDDGRVAETGQGQTINMGSGGIACSLDRELAPGAFVELSISWPVLLDSGTPMRLVVFGRILRCSDGLTACTVDKYEFRTQARPATMPTVGAAAGIRLAPEANPRRWSNGVPPREPLKGGFLGSWTMSSYRS